MKGFLEIKKLPQIHAFYPIVLVWGRKYRNEVVFLPTQCLLVLAIWIIPLVGILIIFFITYYSYIWITSQILMYCQEKIIK